MPPAPSSPSRVRTSPAIVVAVLAAAVGAVTAFAPGCGRSALATAVADYTSTVESRLEGERAVWTKFDAIFRQDQGQDFDAKSFREFVSKGARPYYEKLVVDVNAVKLGDDALRPCHDELLQFVKACAAAVRAVDEDDGFLSPPPGIEDVGRKFAATDTAFQRYTETIGSDGIMDDRFHAIFRQAETFTREYKDPFGEGKVTSAQMQEYVRKTLLPELKKLRETKFLEDESSKRLLAAIVSAEEYYAAVADNVAALDKMQRSYRTARAAVVAADEHLKKFKDELKKLSLQ